MKRGSLRLFLASRSLVVVFLHRSLYSVALRLASIAFVDTLFACKSALPRERVAVVVARLETKAHVFNGEAQNYGARRQDN